MAFGGPQTQPGATPGSLLPLPRNPALLPGGLNRMFNGRRDASRSTHYASISPVSGGTKTPAKRALIGSYE